MIKFWQTLWSKYDPKHAINEERLFKRVAQKRKYMQSLSKETRS